MDAGSSCSFSSTRVQATSPDSSARGTEPIDTTPRSSRTIRSSRFPLRGGIANLEKVHVATGGTAVVTSVTGAAVAPAFNPADRSIWFLSLYSARLRRAPHRVHGEDRWTAGTTSTHAFIPVMPPTAAAPTHFSTNAVSPPKSFGFGPRLFRWIPQPFADADGASVGLGLVSADLIGRSEIVVVGAAGDASQSRGVAAEFTWRGWRTALRARGFVAEQLPSESRSPVPLAALLDVRMSGGEVGLDRAVQFDSWGYRYRIGGSAAAVRDVGDSAAPTSSSTARALGFVDLSASWTKRGDASSFTGTVGASGTGGTSFDRSFSRGSASVGLNIRTPVLPPISGSALYGATTADAPPFEQFAIGGGRSPLVGQTVMSQRISMPALPVGTSIGTRLSPIERRCRRSRCPGISGRRRRRSPARRSTSGTGSSALNGISRSGRFRSPVRRRRALR